MSRRPDFLYIGTSKAGSTWLFKLLSWHPQIYVYPGKNLGFFSTRFDKGWDWYIGNFQPEPQHQAVGEVSHSYLVSEQAPARIREFLPDVKMLVCVREPVQRTFSDYLDGIKNGKLSGTLEEELERTPSLLNKSRYGTMLARYLEQFDRTQFHIASFDELSSAPEQFAAGIFQFIGVDPLEIPPAMRNKILPGGTPRSRKMAKAAKTMARFASSIGLKGLRGRLKTSPAVRNMLYRPFKDSARPTMNPATKARLRELMTDEVRRLDELAGTDFCRQWGYSPAGK